MRLISEDQEIDIILDNPLLLPLFSAFWLRSSVVSVLIVLIGRYGRTAAFPIIHFLKHGGTAELAHGPPRCPRHCTIAL